MRQTEAQALLVAPGGQTVPRLAESLAKAYIHLGSRRATDVFLRAAQLTLEATPGPGLVTQAVSPVGIAPLPFPVAHEPQAPSAQLQWLADEAEVTPFNEALEASMAASIRAIFAGTTWLTAAEVGKSRDPDAVNPYSLAGRWREAGRVLAVEHRGQLRYPRYQFDALFEPIPQMSEILKEFAGKAPLAIASWFESTNSFLDAARPRERLASTPMDVVAAAHDHAVGPTHG